MTIVKTKSGGYVVKSEKTGKPLSKPNLSKAAAAKRIAQVEWFKAHTKKK